MRELALLRAPATVVYGAGTLDRAVDAIRPLGERVLVCSDAFLISSVHGRRLLGSLRSAGLDVRVWDEEAIAFGRDSRAQCVVGFGGGSSLDLAKLVALGMTGASLPACYGEDRVVEPLVPLVAIPTTAGTGSEVTPVAVLSDPDIELKVGIASQRLVPVAAIVDPELTHGCPARLTAQAGMDALAHAIEAFTARRREGREPLGARVFVGKNRLSDAFALTAIRAIAPSLERAIDDDPAAREQMAFGSLTAGLAFATAGTAAAHALQYPIGARTKTAHGVGTGLLLSHAMDFNREARVPELASAARAMGMADGVGDDEVAADRAISGVRALALRVGLPAGLDRLGLAQSELPRLAEQAIGVARLVDNNPRPLDRDGALSILNAAWTSGDVDRPGEAA